MYESLKYQTGACTSENITMTYFERFLGQVCMQLDGEKLDSQDHQGPWSPPINSVMEKTVLGHYELES